MKNAIKVFIAGALLAAAAMAGCSAVSAPAAGQVSASLSPAAVIGGKPADVEAIGYNSRIYVPARNLCKALRKEVVRDEANKEINIKGREGPGVIKFTNKDIEASVRSALNKKDGPILKTDVEKIKAFGFSSQTPGLNPDAADWSYFTNLEELHFFSAYFTTTDSFKALKKLKKVYFEASRVRDLSGFQSIGELTFFSTQIGDIRSLGKLKNLKSLSLGRWVSFGNDAGKPGLVIPKGVVSELTGLEDLSVSELEIGSPGDLAGLDNLKSLSLFIVTINDFSPVFRMRNLKKLDLFGMKSLDSGSADGIKNLNGLEELSLAGCKIRDINFLSGLTGLKKLDLSNNAIEDVKALTELKQLERLELSSNNISDIEPLVPVMKEGSFLGIRNNKLDLSEGSGDLLNIQDLFYSGVDIEYR